MDAVVSTLQLGLDLAVEETALVDRALARDRVASIGPRPRGRGNPPGDPARQALIHCFNWASTSRSRKQFLRPTFGRLLGRLQLGLDLAVEETRRPSDRGGVGFPASIGPRPRGRGNRQNRSATWALLIRFNWASTSRSRKPPEAPRRPGEGQGLQLGLDLAVEETLSHAAQRRAGRRASIGPRPRGRGNFSSSSPLISATNSFNWASTSRSRKPTLFGDVNSVPILLQLGLDLAVEETRPGRGRARLDGSASIGPRPRGRGNSSQASRMSPRRARFNWASTSRSRKRRAPRPRRPGSLRFNWASTSRSRKPLASVSLQHQHLRWHVASDAASAGTSRDCQVAAVRARSHHGTGCSDRAAPVAVAPPDRSKPTSNDDRPRLARLVRAS